MASSQITEKELDFDMATKKLSIFCEQPKSINDMMSLLGWSDRSKFRKRFIYPLLEQGLLSMTVPDKPNSSHQRYVTTEMDKK